MNKTKTKKSGRGRKSGSVSFMQVSLQELNRILQPDARVIISYRFGSLLGIQGKPVGGNLDVLTSALNREEQGAELVEFTDDKGAEKAQGGDEGGVEGAELVSFE